MTSFATLFFVWMALLLRIAHASFDILPSLSGQEQMAIRSQRDLMSNVTIDQLPLVGVNLRNVIFNDESVNDTESLEAFQSLMQNGVQSFRLDLQQNDSVYNLANTDIELGTFLLAFESFVNMTDDNLSANILTLHLNISNAALYGNSSSNGSVVPSSGSVPNITYTLDQSMGRLRIYTPDDLRNDQLAGVTYDNSGLSSSGWPTLNNFLYSKRRRVVITELSNTLNYSETPYIFDSSILHYDVRNKTLETPTTVAQLMNISSISWRYLEADFTPAEIREYTNMGFSPIIANQYSKDNFTSIETILNHSVVWSWDTDQPVTTHTATPKNSDSLVAYNCAVLKYTVSNHSAFWEVNNCYDKYQALCRYTERAYEWAVTEASDTYFAFDRRSESHCPDDYRFALPRTPLEQFSLIMHLANTTYQNIQIWVDMNSIAVSNCWVTGGPYATCPYQKVVSRRNFVTMLTPVTVCCFFILVLVSYLNLLRVPIHSNRKNWKRLLNEVSKSELDGVPS